MSTRTLMLWLGLTLAVLGAAGLVALDTLWPDFCPDEAHCSYPRR